MHHKRGDISCVDGHVNETLTCAKLPHRTLEADPHQQRHREAESRDQEVPTIWVLLLISRLGVQHLAYA